MLRRTFVVALPLLACVCRETPFLTGPASSDARTAAVPDAGPIETEACEPVLGEPPIVARRIVSGLRKPVLLRSAPDDPRLFVVEQHAGLVRVIDRDRQLLVEPFLDLSEDIGKAFEQGIVGLAFHPRFADNGLVYASYTRKEDDAVVVAEWTSPEGQRADPDSRRVLFEVEQSRDFHNGAPLAFDTSGRLLIAFGDGGPQFDLDGHAQTLESLRGKLLRVDVDRTQDDLPYGIPADNPGLGPSARNEIIAYGLRNPWTLAMDPATGHVFIGDVGFDSAEEINVLAFGQSGQNFGWPILEGATECIDADDCDTAGLTPPLLEYDHESGCAVILGPPYRGCRMPGHHGRVFYSDFCVAGLRSFRFSASSGMALDALSWPVSLVGRMPGIGLDYRGEMYMMDFDAGEIYELVPGDSS